MFTSAASLTSSPASKTSKSRKRPLSAISSPHSSPRKVKSSQFLSLSLRNNQHHKVHKIQRQTSDVIGTASRHPSTVQPKYKKIDVKPSGSCTDFAASDNVSFQRKTKSSSFAKQRQTSPPRVRLVSRESSSFHSSIRTPDTKVTNNRKKLQNIGVSPNTSAMKKKKKTKVRPFRVKVGCVVALRYQSPTKLQNIVRILPSKQTEVGQEDLNNNNEISCNEKTGKKVTNNSTNINKKANKSTTKARSKKQGKPQKKEGENNVKEMWVEPQPGRDEGYALIGKIIRCILPPQDAEGEDWRKNDDQHHRLDHSPGKNEKNTIQGEVVSVQRKGVNFSGNCRNITDADDNLSDDDSSSNDDDGIRIRLLVSDAKLESIPFLRSFIDDDINDISVSEKEKERRRIEKKIRGDGKVIIKITLKYIVSFATTNNGGDRDAKRKKKRYKKRLVTSRWVIKKKIPFSLGDYNIKQVKKGNKRYVGDGNDDEVTQKNNWRWLVGKKLFNLNNDLPPSDNSNSSIDPILIGEVMKVVCGKSNTSTLATVTLKKLHLPEHTHRGRLSSHAWNEIFEDACEVMGSNKKAISIRGNDSSSASCANHTVYEVPVENIVVLSQKILRIGFKEETTSNNMVNRYNYNEERDIFRPIQNFNEKNSANWDRGTALHNLPLIGICNYCRREGIAAEMKVCSSEICYGKPKEGKNERNLWCAECCHFLLQDPNASCGVKNQTNFGKAIQTNMKRVVETISSLSHDDLSIDQQCATCLRQCVNSMTKCLTCSKGYREDCYNWENSVDLGAHFGMEKVNNAKRNERVNKLQKKQQKRRSLKLCYDCLFAQSDLASRDWKKIITNEANSTIFNATEKILSMMAPADFDLPFSYPTNIPLVKATPHEEISKEIVSLTLGEEQNYLPQSKRKPSNSPASSSTKRRKKKETHTCLKVQEEDVNKFQPTCSRILSYTKQVQCNVSKSSAENTVRTFALASSSKKRNKRGNRGENGKMKTDGENQSNNRAARAKQRRMLKDDVLLCAVKEQLSGCEQSLRFGKSMIHDWGVFADADINAGDLIVEYRGVLIGHAVADKREKEYEKAKIGSDYMFRIDSETVCDATHQGNVARFINASCAPNCYTQIITVNSAKRIVIYAKRDIIRGEELCYDYKFQPEFDESKRIPCRCGTSECRGFMNWDKRYVAIPNAKQRGKNSR